MSGNLQAGVQASVRAAMCSRDYYEEAWEGVPEGLEPPLGAQRLAFLLGHLSAGQSVLDIGCGEGWFTQALRDSGIAAVGMDVAKEPLRRAQRRRPDLDLRTLEATGPWPLPDASFDVVWAGEVIEHVHDTASWLSEARRVLRSGGRLLLSTPAHDRFGVLALALSGRAFAAHFDPCSEHLRFYSRRSLRQLLQDFRFEHVEIRGLGGLPCARETLLASAQRARF